MGLFSKELQELDRNTVQYMIDEMQEEINQQKEQLAQKEQQLTQKEQQLSLKDRQLTEKDLQIQQQAQKIAELMQKLENQKNSRRQKMRKHQKITEDSYKPTRADLSECQMCAWLIKDLPGARLTDIAAGNFDFGNPLIGYNDSESSAYLCCHPARHFFSAALSCICSSSLSIANISLQSAPLSTL